MEGGLEYTVMKNSKMLKGSVFKLLATDLRDMPPSHLPPIYNDPLAPPSPML